MRLLDRYLLRELLVPLGYCLGGILVFWISADLVTEMEELQESNLEPIEVFEYYLVKLPELLATVLPISLLLALLYALTNHARNQELIAIRCAGVSLWRLSVPYFAVGIGLSLALFGIQEFWLPKSARLAEQIIEQGESDGYYYQNVNFRNARDNRIWYIQEYDPIRNRMVSPGIEWYLADGSSRHWMAERGIWTNGVWQLQDVQGFYYPPDREEYPQPIRTNSLTLPTFAETPSYIELETKLSRVDDLRDKRKVHMSIQEILKYQYLNPEIRPAMERLLATKLQKGLATPLTCMVVVVIAIPFAVGAGRRDVFVGVASSISICMVYIILQRLAFSLGIGAYVPPWVAAWLPNAAFALLGLTLMYRIR